MCAALLQWALKASSCQCCVRVQLLLSSEIARHRSQDMQPVMCSATLRTSCDSRWTCCRPGLRASMKYLAGEGAGDGAVLATRQQRNAEQDLGGVAAHRRRQQAVRVGDVLHRRVGVGAIVERACAAGDALGGLTSSDTATPSASEQVANLWLACRSFVHQTRWCCRNIPADLLLLSGQRIAP